MLQASLKGKLETTEKQPDKDTIINGRMFKPLSPKVYFSSEVLATLKFERYTIMTIAWGSLEKPKFNIKDNYLRSLASMYVATVKCGVSQQMLEKNSKNLIGGVLKYHIALTFQLMYSNPGLLETQLDKTDIEIIVNNIPTRKLFWDTKIIQTSKDPGE